MLLSAYPEFDSDSAAATEASLIKNAGGRRFELNTPSRGFRFRANAARLETVSALCVGCNASGSLSFNPATYVRQIYQTSGASRISVGKLDMESIIGDVGYIIHDGSEWHAHHPSGFENLVVRAELSSLERKLSAMTGTECRNLAFEQPSRNGEKMARFMKASAFQFAAEMDLMGSELSRLTTLELEQSILGRFLIYNLHNHSHLLVREVLSAGIRQLRIVEDYIIANWDAAIDVETLALVSGVSARSVFRSFKAWCGCSPQEFVRSVRLNRAREMLLGGDHEISVMRVGLKCGFKSLGHFAREYRLQFGELPSATARRPSKTSLT